MLEPASIGSIYREGIVDTGREPAFLFLVSFLCTFAFIRTSAHMIRAQVPWWPGNVNVGGTHIHHLVWGILVLLISGYIGIVADLGSPGREMVAIAFGFGTGLTLDEFALWFELRDVYWEQEGRKSIDAVIIAAILAGFGVLGFAVWVEVADGVASEVRTAAGAIGAVGILTAVINASKQKFWTAGAALLVPLIGVVGAMRLARPESLWSHKLYDEQKAVQACGRFGVPLAERVVQAEAGSGVGPAGGESPPAPA